MKNDKNYLFIFIASIIVGVLISLNFKSDRTQSYNQLNTGQYKDAIEERAALYKEIGNLKEENAEKVEKISDYKVEDKNNDKIIEDMKAQIKDYEMFTGMSEVKGPGIILTINDGDINIKEQSSYEVFSRIFHDNDMARVLNEVKNAGAEAITVNKHRIIPWTAVMCNWAFIGFEDGSMESAPFNIYAIGDPDKLEAALLDEGSYINELILRKLKVDIQKVEEIVMPPTSSNGNVIYMERIEKNK